MLKQGNEMIQGSTECGDLYVPSIIAQGKCCHYNCPWLKTQKCLLFNEILEQEDITVTNEALCFRCESCKSVTQKMKELHKEWNEKL